MPLNNYNQKVNTLFAKGGIMFFAIERYPRFYRGAVMLSPLSNNHQKRAVYIKEYLWKNKNIVESKKQEEGRDEIL